MAARSEFIQKMQNGIFEGIHKTKEPFYQGLAEDIVKQRKRLGGNWAIAEAIFSRKEREFLRTMIGNDLVFIVLNLTETCQIQRQVKH